MRYFLLVPNARDEDNYVLFDINQPRVQPRVEYAGLRCNVCGKLDEEAALRRGVPPTFRVAGNSDFIWSNDGLLLMSRRVVNALVTKRCVGLEWLALPGDSRYLIGWPNPRATTSRENNGLRIVRGPCPVCGRIKETLFSPGLWAMTPPKVDYAIFGSEIWSETSRGKMTWVLASEPTIRLLEELRATGITWSEALDQPLPGLPT